MAAAETEGDVELDFTVVGTCQVLEKKYLRLTSAPDPRTVRPEPVLRKSIELIRAKMEDFTDDPDQVRCFGEGFGCRRGALIEALHAGVAGSRIDSCCVALPSARQSVLL
eukprot:6203483-Pleurochrysis_carterae.AAC.1